VALTRAIIKIARSCPRGGGKNQHNNNAERLNLMLIKKMGGNSAIPIFARVKPIPQITGTDSARPMSLIVIGIILKQAAFGGNRNRI